MLHLKWIIYFLHCKMALVQSPGDVISRRRCFLFTVTLTVELTAAAEFEIRVNARVSFRHLPTSRSFLTLISIYSGDLLVSSLDFCSGETGPGKAANSATLA